MLHDPNWPYRRQGRRRSHDAREEPVWRYDALRPSPACLVPDVDRHRCVRLEARAGEQQLECGGVRRRGDDLGTVTGEPDGDGSPDTATRSGDEHPGVRREARSWFCTHSTHVQA